MQIETTDGIAVLRMAEGKANAMNPAFVAALASALETVEASGAKALVLTGEGRHFCAGLDLQTLSEVDAAAMERFLADFERALIRCFLLPMPVVAAVNGNAIAGGCVLAAAADHRVASRADYRIGLNEARIGVSFPSAATEIPRCLLPPASLRRALLEGDLFAPDGALALGLVDELVDPDALLPRAREIAARLMRSPQPAFAQVKRELRAPYARRVERDGAGSRVAFRRLWFSAEALRLRQEVLARGKR